jgi:hypothetical protein
MCLTGAMDGKIRVTTLLSDKWKNVFKCFLVSE